MSVHQKVPYKRYLQTLVLMNTPDDLIHATFTRRKLALPSKELIQKIRKEVWSSFSDDIKKFYKEHTGMVDIEDFPQELRDHMYALGLSDVLKNPSGFTAAKSIFDQVDLRVCAYSHILSQQPEETLVDSLNTMTKYPGHPDAIDIFKKFFCDMRHMDYPAWKEFIHELKGINHFEAEIYAACFNSRYPFDLVRWKIHAKLGTQDVDELLKSLVVYTYYKTLENLETADPADYEMVQSWIEKFLKTYEKHKTLGKGKTQIEGHGNPLEEAMFQLDKVRTKPRNVTELGDSVSKVAEPIIIEVASKKVSID